MPTLSADTERLLTGFAAKTGVTTDQVNNLRASLVDSPVLARQIDAAIAAGHLQQFALLPAGSTAGGTYDGDTKAINLPASSLSTPIAPARYDAAELTFVLGHEIQHGFNHAATTQAYAQFENDLDQVAGLQSSRDYTPAIATLLAANRRDEASANIEGWNALVSRVTSAHPDPTLQDLYDASPRARDIVRMLPGPPATYAVHPELTLNADLSLTATAANLEGMGKHYYDKGVASGLGHHGNSDYQNFYGAYAISRACQYEAANPAADGITRMSVNLAQLGLKEDLLEQNGLHLDDGTPSPQAYFDTSTSPSTLHHFNHTEGTYSYVPTAAQPFAHRPIDLSQAQDLPGELHRPLPAGGNDHALHEQIRGKVGELDAARGRTFDADSERLSASLLLLARENGLDRVDHVVLSRQTADAAAAQHVFVVKGALDDPASQRAWATTAEAVQRPVQESLDSLALVNQRQADQASQEQTRVQVHEQQRGALSH